jgi:hypothetical protein
MNDMDIVSKDFFSEFIEEYEDKWLQYSSIDTKIQAFFGSSENLEKAFEDWKNGVELFSVEKKIFFPKPYKFE